MSQREQNVTVWEWGKKLAENMSWMDKMSQTR